MEQNNQRYKLSPQQRRAFSLQKIGAAYFGQCNVKITGRLDAGRLMQCWDELIARHEILRTSYHLDDADGYPIQLVEEAVAVGPVIKTQVLLADLRHDSDTIHWLNFRVSLMAADSVSLRNIVTELGLLYADKKLPPTGMQYIQFANWQNELLDMPEESGKKFWNKFDAALYAAPVFPYSIVPTSQGFLFTQAVTYLSTELQEQIISFCEQHHCNTETFFAACLAVLIQQYKPGPVHAGYVMSERDYQPLQSAIGNMARTLPLDLTGIEDKTFLALLEELGEQHSNMLAWKEAFDPVAGLNNGKPIFSVGYEFLSCRLPQTAANDVRFEIDELIFINEPFAVKLFVAEYEKGIAINWYYNANSITADGVKMLDDQLAACVQNVLTHPHEAVSRIQLLSAAQRKIIVEQFGFSAPMSMPETLMPLLHRRMEHHSHQPAVLQNGQEFTYLQIHDMSNQLAWFLVHDYGVRPGDYVGLLMNKSVWTIISILAVLKVRAAFIPLDPNYPAERIKYIATDSGAAAWLTSDSNVFNRFELTTLQGIALPEQWDRIAQMPVENIDACYSKDDTAYVIYTSGTTGTPKGVQVGVHSLLNYLNWANTYYFNDSSGKPFAFFTSLSFDLTLTSIFSPLLRGELIIAVDHPEIIESLTEIFGAGSGVQTVKLTPSHINLLNSCPIQATDVSIAIVGGEALTQEHVKILRQLNPQMKIYNEYGPTEATIGCIVKEIRLETEKITIGNPIANTHIYILNERMQLQPVGIKGEIYIAGEALALGYLSHSTTANNRFIENPFQAGTRLYKTGDAGKWLENGEIEYHGRIDRQLKLRGYRIEPAEIEEVLLNFEGITQVAVMAAGPDRSELTAYYAGPAAPDNGDIISFLKRCLPDFMIPAWFIRLTAFPLTNNGKINYDALPDPTQINSRQAVYQPANTLLEWQLVRIWEQVLERGHISMNDNFFELGGHSLKAIRILSRIYKELHVKLNIKSFLAHATVGELASYILSLEKQHYQAIPNVEEKPVYPLSPAQKRLWVLDQLNEQNGAYNMAAAFIVYGELQVELFKKAVAAIINRHESLRTLFKTDSGEPVQVVKPASADQINFEYLDFENSNNAARWIEDSTTESFDLEKGPLFKVRVARLSHDESHIAFTMHHIISDGWSLRILMKEIKTLYENLLDNKPFQRAALPIQYKDYAAWQVQQLKQENFEIHKSYWLHQFADEVPVLDLPSTFTRPAARSARGGGYHAVIDPHTTTRLKAYADKKRATSFMVLLTTLNVLLYRYTNQHNLVIGTPVAGRDHDMLEDQVGFYLNLLPLRIRIDAGETFAQLLEKIRETTLSAYAHQAYPFDVLVNELNLDRDISRSPLFDILLSLDNTATANEESFQIADLDVRPYILPSYSNKYDLAFYFYETEGTLRANIEFSRDLFSDAYIAGLAQHFIAVLQAGMANDTLPVASIEYLSHNEKEKLISDYNDTEVVYRRDETMPTLFEKMAKDWPNKIAVWDGSVTYTYTQLNEQSNRLANLLREKEIGRGHRVALMVDRSALMITGVLGILKSGAAYVPIDPEYPTDRIQFILEDSQCALLITDKEVRAGMPSIQLKDAQDLLLTAYESANIPAVAFAEDLAYVIYTSGSTGKPKGVQVRHVNLTNFFTGMDRGLHLDTHDTLLAVTSISFDISILELFWTLCRGVGVVIKKDAQQIANFNDFLNRKDNVQMEFSLFFFASYQQNAQDKYKLLFDAVEYADKNGFKAVWTPERHFHEFGGIFPSPAVISAAIAAKTRSLEIRAGSLVLPLHDVVRAAEEWSVLDNISAGRVGLSMTYGWHADDFIFYPEEFAARKEKMYTQIEEFKSLWKGATVRRKNGLGKEIDIKIFPAPMQPDIPVWLTSSGSPDTFRRAGEIGANILTHFLGQDLLELDKNIRIYKEALLANGHVVDNARISVMLHTYIGDNLTEVKQDVQEPFKEYLRSNADLRQRITASLTNEQVHEKGTREWWDEVAELAFERYWQTAALLGTPASCAPIVRQLASIGVTEIACLIDFGVENEKILNSLEALAVFKDNYKPGAQALNKPAITALQTTPSLLKTLWKDLNSRAFLQSLQKIIIGGEALPENLVRELKTGTSATLYNMYGPTETTIWSSMACLDDSIVNAGKPIANTCIYILDKQLNLVPAGIPGEIFIGGEGVAAGYLNRDELTRERFLPNHIAPHQGSTLYRTGDVGRWHEDNLEIIGRSDNQVKLRGYRIEPGEIEKVLLTHAAVVETAVVLEKDGNGDAFLTAFCVMPDHVGIEAIRTYLLNKLPAYMVPARFLKVSKLPLTPNGKLDKKALALLSTGKREERRYQPPTNEKEALLAGIWETVFNKKNIGINDDFFAMGGDSIKAIQILSRLQQSGYKLQLRNILQYPYISHLAAMLEKNGRVANEEAVTGEVPLTPIQHWFFELPRKKKHHYNQAVVLQLEKDIDKLMIETIFSKIQEHHDALRIVFAIKEAGVSAFNCPATLPLSLLYHDLRAVSNAEVSMQEEIAALQSGIDLEHGPLMKPALFLLPMRSVLVIVIHHLVIDGISWRILFEDMNTLYEQYRSGQPLSLPSKTHPFKQWAEKLQVYSSGRELLQQLPFWRSMQETTVPAMVCDHAAGSNTGASSARLSFQLNTEETDLLLTQTNKAFNTETTEILLTALALAMEEEFGVDRLLLSLERHGREDLWEEIDVSRSVGWFTTMYPVLISLRRQKDLGFVIKEVKEQLRAVPDNGLGYGVLRYLTRPTHSLSPCKPQISFNYLGQFSADLDNTFFKVAGDEGFLSDPEDERDFELELVSMIISDELQMTLTYPWQRYEPERVQRLMTAYKKALQQIILWCAGKWETELTPSDLTHKGLTIEALDTINELFN